MKNYIAMAIILFGIYLCFEENIVKNSFYKEIIEELLLLVVIFCCIFNLVLIKLTVGSWSIEIGILSIIMLIYVYIFFVMFKKDYSKKDSDKSVLLLFICLSLINTYMLLEPTFLYIYSAKAYSLYLLTYFNIELMLIIFLILRGFKYRTEIIVNLISVFSVMNALLGLAQYLTGRVLINFKDTTAQLTQLAVGGRISGFVIGDNGGGNLGAIVLPVLLYKYRQKKSILNFSLILIDILFTIFTFTRIAQLAICVELLVYIIFSTKIITNESIVKYISGFIVVIGAGAYFCVKYSNSIISIFILQRGNTQSDRFIQFHKAIKAFLSTPILGTGHGQYNEYLMHQLGVLDTLVIHSQLLNMIVEEGVIIFIIFIIFNVCLIYMLMKKYSKKVEALFIIMLVIGNLICINFNPNQTYEINIYIYYFILFGFLFGEKQIIKS